MVKDEKDLFLKTGRNRVHPHNDRRTRGIENLIRWEGSWLADPWTYVSQKPLFTQSGKRIDRRELRRKTPYDLRCGNWRLLAWLARGPWYLTSLPLRLAVRSFSYRRVPSDNSPFHRKLSGVSYGGSRVLCHRPTSTAISAMVNKLLCRDLR